MSESAVPQPAPQAKLSSFDLLFKESCRLYKSRVKTLFGVLLFGALSSIITVVVLVGGILLVVRFVPTIRPLVTLVLGFICFCRLFYLFNRTYLAMIYAAETEGRTTKEALDLAKPGTFSFIWVGLLTGLILVGGLLLFIIPGLIIAVWSSFATFVFVCEGSKGMDCLMRSKVLVAGRWWSVAWRIVLVNIVLVVLGLIPVLGVLLNIFLIPFGVVFTFVLYKELVLTRGPEAPHGSKKKVILVSLLGYFVIPVFMLVFAAGLGGLVKLALTNKGPQASPRPTVVTGKQSMAPTSNLQDSPVNATPVSSQPLFQKRSTQMTHEIVLKNNHRMVCLVVERNAQGLWVEMAPGARTYITNGEIAQIVELEKERQVSVEEKFAPPQAASPAA